LFRSVSGKIYAISSKEFQDVIEQRHFDHFKAKRLAVIEGVFSRDKASRIAALSEEVGMAQIDEGEDSHHVVDHGPDGGVLPRKINRSFQRNIHDTHRIL